MRINSFVMSALIALGVIIAYDKYGKHAGGMRRGV